MTELVSRTTNGEGTAEYQAGGAAVELSPRPDGTLEDALGAIIAERVREFRLQLALTVGQLARAGAERIYDLLDSTPVVQNKPGAADLVVPRGEVRFERRP